MMKERERRRRDSFLRHSNFVIIALCVVISLAFAVTIAVLITVLTALLIFTTYLALRFLLLIVVIGCPLRVTSSLRPSGQATHGGCARHIRGDRSLAN
jgi:hypothetical protein